MEAILKMLFYNGYAHASFRGAADLKTATDMYYLMMLPWFKLHGRNIESFRRNGDHTMISLEGSAAVDMDWAQQTYSVAIDGVEIARDLATYCPLDEDRIACYSATARELSRALPKNWTADMLVAFALSTGDRKEVPVTVKNGIFTVSVNGKEPVIIYRNADKALQGPA